MDILSLLNCFQPLVPTVTVRHFVIITQAILAMSGRITMLSISRWTSKGGSYRTVQRFFSTRLPWIELLVRFFLTHLFDSKSEYILAGDATTVTKSGKQTHGIDRFFSGVIGKVVRGLEFFLISLVDVQKRKSYPLAVKQMVRTEAEKEAIRKRKLKQKKKKKKKRGQKAKRGRPPGSRNKDKNEFAPSLDGHFGHHQAVLMARLHGLQLISKMRCNALLFEKYEGEYGGRGRRRRYGEQLDYANLPDKYLKKSEGENEIITNYYNGILLHKKFGDELNVVIIQKINVKTKKVGQVILFTSDTELEWENLVEYYSLRFQIEFNFREAKQHFGLEDFMTMTARGVENAGNLSFLMVLLSEKLKAESDGKCDSTNDLKSHYRGVKYARLALKKVMQKAEAILIKEIIEEVSRLGSIHQPKPTISSA
jgi:putative transposase